VSREGPLRLWLLSKYLERLRDRAVKVYGGGAFQAGEEVQRPPV